MDESRDNLIQQTVRGFRWSMRPGLQGELLSEDGLRLREWIAAGQASVVKQGPHRIVYRVDLPHLRFYVKHNLVQDQRSWFRQLLRASKARIEFDCIREATARGIPTIHALALAEEEARVGTGESFLITQTLDDCIPLHLFLAGVLPTFAEPRASRLRQRLAVELGKLIARVHDAGLLHHDLHAANLLVRIGDKDRIELFVIDLLAVKIGPPLDWEQSRDNLVMLNCWFTLRVNRADRLRFWKAYFLARQLGAWQKDPHGVRRYLRELPVIEALSWKRNLRFWGRRDKRCLVNNRYYQKLKAPGLVGHAVTEVDPEDLAKLLRDPDAPFRDPGARVLKDSISATVIEMTFRINGQIRPVIYKRFKTTVWKDPIASLFRPTPALRSWVQGQGFRERGLPTARPFAVLHRRRLGMLHEGYLLMEKIAHAGDLHESLASLGPLPERRRLKLLRPLLVRVARTIRALHQCSLSHRDLKAANVLVRRWNAPPREPSSYSQDIQNLLYVPENSVWLIDLVGVEQYATLSRSRKIQNLARLNASFHAHSDLTRTDRLRFLLAYLQCGAFGRCNWKSWWKQINETTGRKIRRNERYGKPLL